MPPPADERDPPAERDARDALERQDSRWETIFMAAAMATILLAAVAFVMWSIFAGDPPIAAIVGTH